MRQESQTSKDDIEAALLNDITQQRIFKLFREVTPLSSISLWEVKESRISGLVVVVLEYRCKSEDGDIVKISLIVDAKEGEGVDVFTITHVAGPIHGSDCLIYAVSGELTSRDDEVQEQRKSS